MVTDLRKDLVAFATGRALRYWPAPPSKTDPTFMAAPELVIFDCDGVLVDSEIIASRVEAALLSEAGFRIEPEELAERFAGLTFPDMLARVEKEAGIPLQASLIERQRDLLDRALEQVRAVEGVHDAVRAAGPRICVCSNSRPERIDMMLSRTGLKPLFGDRIFSSAATPSKRPKPAPDVFLHAAETMNAAPAGCFVIEDSVHGIAGAVAAGMRVIGFTGGAHSWPGHADALTEAGAETVIRRWADLKPVLAALAVWAE
jgi:HAD superfamily hydrolase (TIGR01509 family)